MLHLRVCCYLGRIRAELPSRGASVMCETLQLISEGRCPEFAMSLRVCVVKAIVIAFLLPALWLLCALPIQAAPLQLGSDLPYTVHEDVSGELTRDEVLPFLQAGPEVNRLGAFSKGYTRSAYWLRFELPATAFVTGERWMQVRPNFLDDVRIFYRPLSSGGVWQERRAGDTQRGVIGDVDDRFALFVMPTSETGYEVLLRVVSSSAMLLQLVVWVPTEFTPQAMRATGLWSAYFGLAALSSLMALALAIVLKKRLLWSVTAMSVSYGLVACIQGYVAWIVPGIGRLLQHYLTGGLTLLSYAAVLWMAVEALGLRRRLPWVYRLVLGSSGLIVLLLSSIPLGLYGEAVGVLAVLYLPTGFLCIGIGLYLWLRDRPSFADLLLGASPLFCIAVSLFGLFSVFGWVPFREGIYVVWQIALVVNMLLVTAIAVFQVRDRRLQEVEKTQLARELRVEREARFHQRQFMGMVAHEFRTPLAVISASLENLRLLPASCDQARRYNRIGRASERLVQLTDNCLADARLDAGELLIVRKMTCLVELLASAASLVRLSDHHCWKLMMEGEVVSDVPAINAMANVDPALMRIALSNVIDNAVKYSSGGTILIELARADDGWSIAVTDSGKGVDESLMGIIFERYRQANDLDQPEQGVGLGLYVSRQILRAHSGDLRLARNTTSGCRFAFTFPDHREDCSA